MTAAEINEPEEFLEILRKDGHISNPTARLTPLSGGVSSEIYRVDDGENTFVVKRALAKLKVQQDWFADVGRNASEQAYLECVGRLMPTSVPRLLFTGNGYFGMEFLGSGFANWKERLLAGDLRVEDARRTGATLGEIHRRTAGNQIIKAQFDTTANFRQLRTEPYLLALRSQHPNLRKIIGSEVERMESTHEVLVHGDYSPKNILMSGERIVLLDCEVAWYGDPAFDVAFLLSHLFLKALHHKADLRMAKLIAVSSDAYMQEMSGGAGEHVMLRVPPLLLLLLLARVDGKSPVEYLSVAAQNVVRNFVLQHLPMPPVDLAELNRLWFDAISLSSEGRP
jgi:aminoglycoside phosphotransferase (APT) family kinase protein